MRVVDFPLCIGKFFIYLGFCFGDFVERVLTNLLCSRLLALFFDPFNLGGEVVEKRGIFWRKAFRACAVLGFHVYGGEHIGGYGIGCYEERVVGRCAGSYGDGSIGVGELGWVDHASGDGVLGSLEYLVVVFFKRYGIAERKTRVG